MISQTSNSNPQLFDRLVQQITESPRQRITFADYMDLVLYHPQHGYYATNQVNIGVQGDFFTSPHLGTDFGELLAEQFAEIWDRLDRPHPFTLVEMGAGQGLLVQDISRYLHRHHFECFAALEYIVIEKSTALIAEQQRRLQPLTQSWGSLTWRTWAEIPSESIVGCCFSNELVDAFPVHLVTVQSGQLQEIYVGLKDSCLTEIIGELSTPKIQDYFNLVETCLWSDTYPEGYRTEVNLAALDWIKTVSDRLHQGYLLTIDYGYPATRYYAPGRYEGTLQCYYQHAHHSNPYLHLGHQDITAHVNFTALERQGDRCGLQKVGLTQQGLFLMALGLGDRLNALSDPSTTNSLQEVIERREAIHALMNPLGLGNFGVLVQSKGLSDRQGQGLKGFSFPSSLE